MTTFFMMVAMLFLPVAPMLAVVMMVFAFIWFRMTDPLGDIAEMILFYGAASGMLVAFTGW